MLVVRGTKKLRDRIKTAPAAGPDDESTTLLGDWFATVLFWKPQVVLLVNRRTFLPVFMPLAPAKTLLDRIPDAVESVLREHGMHHETMADEWSAMCQVRVAPTDDRSVLGVMNEFASLGEIFRAAGDTDLDQLSRRMSDIIVGPLGKRAGTPARELAVVLGLDGAGGAERLAGAADRGQPLADVIDLFSRERVPATRPVSPRKAASDARKASTRDQAPRE